MIKLRSVKTNMILNTFRVLSSAGIGVFTMPYINNALGPVYLGKVEYINSIINYFILFSALGLPMYAIRQIAKVRDSKEQLTYNTIEIYLILIFTSLISYTVLYIILYNSKFLVDYQQLVILMSSMIFLTNLGGEWFFQGVEDQMYITIRYVIVRILTLILLFILVKSTEDYLYYALILVLNTCGSNLFNLYKIIKELDFKNISIKKINIVRHLKPALTIFIAALSVNIYLQIDYLMLGYYGGDQYVGYYSVANKLIRYVIIIITIVGAVLLPRLANLWENDKEKYYDYLKFSLNIIILLGIPCVSFFLLFAENIIEIMAGSAFNEAIITIKLLSPLCLIVGIAYFFGYLVLYTQNLEKYYSFSVIVSAIISICVNYFLINRFYHNGAAVTQVLAELSGILIMIIYIKRAKLKLTVDFKNIIKILFSSLVCYFIIYLSIKYLFTNNNSLDVYTFLLMVVLFFAVNLMLMLILKEKFSRLLLCNIIQKFNNN